MNVRGFAIGLCLLGLPACNPTSTTTETVVVAVVNLSLQRAPSSPVGGASVALIVADSARGVAMLYLPAVTPATGRVRFPIAFALMSPFTASVSVRLASNDSVPLPDTTYALGYVHFTLSPPSDSLAGTVTLP